MEPTTEAIAEYKNGNKATKVALINIFGKDAFIEKKEILEPWQDKINRLKTFADILKEVGETAKTFTKRTKGMSPDTVGYEKIKLITKAFNGKNKIDWNNSNQPKYRQWFEYDSKTGRFVFDGSFCRYTITAAGLGSRLYFFYDEHAEYAGKQFIDEYNEQLLG